MECCNTPEDAANKGHLDCLKYAHENGGHWDEFTCSNAAKYGHLNCLEFAHENGCPWDEKTCEFAIRGCNFHIFKWLRENNCPWNKDVCLALFTKYNDRKSDMFEWIKNN